MHPRKRSRLWIAVHEENLVTRVDYDKTSGGPQSWRIFSLGSSYHGSQRLVADWSSGYGHDPLAIRQARVRVIRSLTGTAIK